MKPFIKRTVLEYPKPPFTIGYTEIYDKKEYFIQDVSGFIICTRLEIEVAEWLVEILNKYCQKNLLNELFPVCGP